ncbi:MAG: hypothetical protein ACR2QO_20660 [Acidimicrobiales bacterium]
MNPVANPADLESDSRPDLDLETPFDIDDRAAEGELDQQLERNLDQGDAVAHDPEGDSSEDASTAVEVDEILGQLHEGLQKAEATMASILEGIVADNASVLSDLEAALTDMEAALATE